MIALAAGLPAVSPPTGLEALRRLAVCGCALALICAGPALPF